jgi:transcriptional regulator with XRE-family HTH domain
MTLNDAVLALIEAAMKNSGETLRSLAPRVGHTHHWLWKRLSGKTELSLEDLDAIAEALGLAADDLIARATEARRTTAKLA